MQQHNSGDVVVPDCTPRGVSNGDRGVLTAWCGTTDRGRARVNDGRCDRDVATPGGLGRVQSLVCSLGAGVQGLGAAQAVSPAEKLTAVVCDLTLLGKTQTVTLKANHDGCHDKPMLKRQVCGGVFEATLQRTDFGMSHGLPFITNDIKRVIQVEAVKQ